MPHDLDLEGQTLPMGTLLLLPLVYKGRPLGCVYAFVRCNPKTVASLAGWKELAGGFPVSLQLCCNKMTH